MAVIFPLVLTVAIFLFEEKYFIESFEVKGVLVALIAKVFPIERLTVDLFTDNFTVLTSLFCTVRLMFTVTPLAKVAVITVFPVFFNK